MPRPILSLLLLVCAAGALPAREAQGDAIVMTKAMKASTIAEIYIDTDVVRLELETSAADLQRMGLTTRPGPEREPTRRWAIEADGTPLRGTVRAAEQRVRIVRDEITGDPLPVQGDEPEQVAFLIVEFPFSGQPNTLSFRPPTEGGYASVNIGFVAYHQGVLVTDFRYLSGEATLDLDWDDPWYSQFRNRNLRRRHAAPISAFLYIEPYEVRQELVLRPKDLQHWTDLGLKGKQVIAAGDQAALKDKAVRFLLAQADVTIDGIQATLELDRIHFIRRTLRQTTVVDPPEDLPLASATLGVIFRAPVESLPKRVEMRWKLWSPRVQMIPASATDEAGGMPSRLTPEDPILAWQNFLTSPRSLAFTAISAPPREAGWRSVLALGAACLTLGLGLLALLRRRRSLALAAMAAAVAAALLSPHLPWRALRGGGNTPEDANAVVSGLLQNVYRSFDRREESIVYDRLARSIEGPLLEQAYLQIRRSTELANQGGAHVKVKDVELISFEPSDSVEGPGFGGACEWNVSGSVGHWGHVHQRTNRYRAQVRIAPVDGVWKLQTLDVLDETRLSGAAAR